MKIEKYAMPNVQLFVLANKSDAEEDLRKITSEQGEKFCKQKNLVFTEVSAKSGQNVGLSFHKIGESLIKIYPKADKQNVRNPAIDDIAKKKREFQLQNAADGKKSNKSCC